MTKAKIILGKNGVTAVMSGMSALVTTEKVDRPTTPIIRDYNVGTDRLAKWGDDNLFPQNVITECSKNTIIPSTLEKKVGLLYSGGIYTSEFTGEYVDDEGTEKTKPISDPQVEDFFKKTNINRYILESANDFYWFYNPFPELILSGDRSKITAISAQEAAYCRWSLQNPSNGLIEYCFINANWENFASSEDINTSKIPVMDPYYDAVGNLRGMGEHKVIYPISYPTPGKTYYQLAHWNSVRSSGWLDVAQSIPEFKKYMFENQITLKYHVQIPDTYWTWKYTDWDTKKDEEKITLINSELELFEKVMTGKKAGFKSHFSSYEVDQHTGKEMGKWIITELGAMNNSNMYIEDSGEASSHLLYALGVDPSIVGYSIGKGMGAGSGSDKREAFNMYQMLCQAHRDIILEPLNFIRDYNGWNPNLRFKFRYGMLKTADTKKPEDRSISNGTI